MIIELADHSPGEVYHLMTQSLVPRPSAWVLSVNDNGSYNLAPFSYFNAISSDPPLVMMSIGKKPDGSDKDTHRNIRERKHYTIHIADSSLSQQLNDSSATLPANTSEVEQLGMETMAFGSELVPRLAQAKIAYACTLRAIHEVGNTPQAVIYGEITAMYIDDSITSTNDKGRIRIHADRLQPLPRLGAGEFMLPGEIISLKRPG